MAQPLSIQAHAHTLLMHMNTNAKKQEIYKRLHTAQESGHSQGYLAGVLDGQDRGAVGGEEGRELVPRRAVRVEAARSPRLSLHRYNYHNPE